MGETFDITFLICKKKVLTIQSLEKVCSSYFDIPLSTNKKVAYNKKKFLSESSQLILTHYYEKNYSYEEFSVSFSDFKLNKPSLPSFYETVDVLLKLLMADAAICSFEINSLNISDLITIEQVITQNSRFPFMFISKKYNIEAGIILENSVAIFNPNAQKVM